MTTPAPTRVTVDLDAYPDLVVIYLGMRVNSPRGMRTLARIGPQINAAVAEKPDGLLLHESVLYGLLPPHVGMRQYWRDFGTLERWARQGIHAGWWKSFLADRGGTGFWHETYGRNGLMESVFIDMPPLGFTRFASVQPARGSMFSARRRLGLEPVGPEGAPVLSEDEVYRG